MEWLAEGLRSTRSMHTRACFNLNSRVVSAQLVQQILRMDRLGKYLELIALGARFFQKVGGCRLSGKEQYLDSRDKRANPDGRVNSIESPHDDIGNEHIRHKSGDQFQGSLPGVNGLGLKSALV